MSQALRAALGLLGVVLLFASRSISPAQNADALSPVVSYQFLNSLADQSGSSPATSRIVSYQYYEWIGDQNLTFQNSPSLSYYFNGAPQILTQPLGQVTKVGGAASFSITVEDSLPVNYQWRLNGINIPGATAASLAINNVQLTDSGTYSVAILNARGSLISNNANLTVYLPPATLQPPTPKLTAGALTISNSLTTSPFSMNGQLLQYNPSTNSFDSITQPLATDRATVILTHGWSSNPFPKNWPSFMAKALFARYGSGVNIVAWNWQKNANLNAFDPAASAARTVSEGVALGQALFNNLGPSYSMPIHFIGHSLGTLVNREAANYIHGDTKRTSDDPFPSTETYAWWKTHLTLLDEAELVDGVKGLHVLLDVLLATDGIAIESDISDTNDELTNFWSKVIPNRYAWIDNYVSEVGLLHPDCANVLLFRKNYVDVVFSSHGYACDWYTGTIIDPTSSLMGHRWSFEYGSLRQDSPYLQTIPPPAYYLQDIYDVNAEMIVSPINSATADFLSLSRLISYPGFAEYQGLSAIGNVSEGLYLDAIQYTGNMAANFAETFSPPPGQPVYLDVANSTPADFISPTRPSTASPQARWGLQFSIQSGTAQLQDIRVPMKAMALGHAIPSAPAAPVCTVIPVQIPTEAVGMSFEYQITGGSAGDYLTMGIGAQSEFTMEAKYVVDGQWNGTPTFLVADLAGQSVQVVFAMNGSGGPASGRLSVRNIRFFIPPRPQLSILIQGSQATVSWPLSALDWTLESTTDLSQSYGWKPTDTVPIATDSFQSITFDITTATRAFFRLIK